MKKYLIGQLVKFSDWLDFDSPWQLYRLSPYVDRLIERLEH